MSILSSKRKYTKYLSSDEDLEIIHPDQDETSSPIQNDFLSFKNNNALFYVQFKTAEYGFFTDIINIHDPVQDVIDRYSKFFDSKSENEQCELVVGPMVGIQKQSCNNSFSISTKTSKRRGNMKDKLHKSLSLAEQKVHSSHVLIISQPYKATLNKEVFQAYLDSKTEEILFKERWLPAVQGCVPLNEDAACVVAASLYTLNSMRNSATGGHNSPRDFIHKEVAVSKCVETKLGRALEDMKQESAESIMKLCTDTILSNFLSAAIIFSVSTDGNTSHKKDAYLVIKSDCVALVKKSDLSFMSPKIRIKDIKRWLPTATMLAVDYENRKGASETEKFKIRSNDADLISSTMTAVAHSTVSKK
eukprot:TRINITY_DN265_c0_g1_i2.p1 TRINITY_DN265_c0_g1~~TRINITY_DN265_c0_g1_i2.p1  ORF type:complete len:368 (-),score=66.40 TRINITY_DN265_c0_g1_i2:155-1237(-)